jgi:hypothetical protein
MQLKDAEGKLSLYTAGNSCTFVAVTVARTSSTTLTLNLTPTPLSSRVVDVHSDPSPSTTAANDASTSRVGNDAVEYIDAADANEFLIYKQHFHTYDYILSPEGHESANQSRDGGPYLIKWPKEWTQKDDALKKSNMDGWVQHVRMMNCMQMFGLGITKDNYLYVRVHRSRGCPHIFWRHECKSADIEVHWKVGTVDDVDVAGRVLKNLIPLDDEDYDESSSPHGLVLHPPFNAYKKMLHECLVVAGVKDHSSLIAALNKYKDQEARLDEVLNAHEELKQQKLKVKEKEVEKNKAVEGLISTDPRFECVAGKRHKLNKRRRERSKQQQQQSQPQQLTCDDSDDGYTSPKRQRLLIGN